MVAAAAVTMGFLLMYMLENLILPHFALSHLGHAHEAATETARRVGGLSVFIALGVHTLIDGIALGVAVTGGEDFALGDLVFVALISHHIPFFFADLGAEGQSVPEQHVLPVSDNRERHGAGGHRAGRPGSERPVRLVAGRHARLFGRHVHPRGHQRPAAGHPETASRQGPVLRGCRSGGAVHGGIRHARTPALDGAALGTALCGGSKFDIAKSFSW